MYTQKLPSFGPLASDVYSNKQLKERFSCVRNICFAQPHSHTLKPRLWPLLSPRCKIVESQTPHAKDTPTHFTKPQNPNYTPILTPLHTENKQASKLYAALISTLPGCCTPKRQTRLQRDRFRLKA